MRRDTGPRASGGQRDLEAMVLTVLIEAQSDGVTQTVLRRELTSIESTPERGTAISLAVAELVDVGLAARAGDGRLRPTPAGRRAGELEATR